MTETATVDVTADRTLRVHHVDARTGMIRDSQEITRITDLQVSAEGDVTLSLELKFDDIGFGQIIPRAHYYGEMFTADHMNGLIFWGFSRDLGENTLMFVHRVTGHVEPFNAVGRDYVQLYRVATDEERNAVQIPVENLAKLGS